MGSRFGMVYSLISVYSEITIMLAECKQKNRRTSIATHLAIFPAFSKSWSWERCGQKRYLHGHISPGSARPKRNLAKPEPDFLTERHAIGQPPKQPVSLRLSHARARVLQLEPAGDRIRWQNNKSFNPFPSENCIRIRQHSIDLNPMARDFGFYGMAAAPQKEMLFRAANRWPRFENAHGHQPHL